MNLRNKWTMGVLGLGAALVIGASATAVYAQTVTPDQPPADLQRLTKEDHSALLAEMLGISVEQLQAAQTQVRNAAIDQAVVEGRLTQEQADQMKQEDFGRGRGFGRPGEDSNRDALLAQALGITLEQLQAAKSEVQNRLLDEAVASGEITQEEADLMQARQALHEYLRDRMQTAYETAVAQAVADGVITQAQADQILAEDDGFRFFGGPGMGGGRHHGGPGGPPGGIPNDAPLQPDDSTPEESDGTNEPATALNL